MLKTLTLSLSLAVALGFCSMSRAGGFHDGCSTCGIASPQGPAPSAQASPQGECYTPCAAPAKKKCCLFEKMAGMGNQMSCNFASLCQKLKPKPPVYTYEWVLKKKRVWCHKSNPCGSQACETCAPMASAQGYASPQAFGTYGSGQAYAAPSYGSGQLYAAPTSGTMAAPAAAHGDEAPPAPEVTIPSAPAPSVPAAPSVPTAPVPPPPPATSGLLFSTPSGN